MSTDPYCYSSYCCPLAVSDFPELPRNRFLSPGEKYIARSDRHHSQRGRPRMRERPGERGRRRDGKNEETQTKNYPDPKAGVHAHPLKLNRHRDAEVIQVILNGEESFTVEVAGHNFGGGSRDHGGRNSSSCCSGERQGFVSWF